MTPELRATALKWQAAGRPAVVVEVTRSRGSVPRDAGTRMLVAQGQVVGTIGGGHLELQAIADAQTMLARGASTTVEQRVALGPALGQCCGGVLELALVPLAATTPAEWPDEAPRFVLQLYGAGHVGRAIVRLLAGLPCIVTWIDERESEFPADFALPRHVTPLCVDSVQSEVQGAPAGAHYLVATHSHDLDMALAHEILQRNDIGWFGLIGSHTKRARFVSRLRDREVSEDRLQQMVCPIGLPGISGKQPELIAVAVVAQMLLHAGSTSA